MYCGDALSGLFDVMQHCVVLRAEWNYAADVCEYTAWCPMFDLVPEGEVIPHYDWILCTEGPLVAQRVRP